MRFDRSNILIGGEVAIDPRVRLSLNGLSDWHSDLLPAVTVGRQDVSIDANRNRYGPLRLLYRHIV